MEDDNGISGEETMGRFSPRLLIRSFLSNLWWNLHVVSSAISIAVLVVVIGLVWIDDLVHGDR